MKKILLCALLFSAAINASQKAITDDGNVVILNEDGTWLYENSVEKSEPIELKLNKKIFTKDPDAIFLVKSTKNKTGFWIDPKKWSFEKVQDGSSREYKFQSKNSDLFGLAVTEEIQISLAALPEVALNNFKDVTGGGAQIITQEYRVVNGVTVLYLECEVIYKGTNIIYSGYYFSNESGTTQLVAYSSPNLMNKYKNDIEAFLNGFMVQDNQQGNKRTEENIRSVLDNNKAAMYSAYNEALKSNPDIQGVATYKLNILPNGKVSDVTVKQTPFYGVMLNKKLVSILQSLEFGKMDVAEMATEWTIEFLPE